MEDRDENINLKELKEVMKENERHLKENDEKISRLEEKAEECKYHMKNLNEELAQSFIDWGIIDKDLSWSSRSSRWPPRSRSRPSAANPPPGRWKTPPFSLRPSAPKSVSTPWKTERAIHER